MKRSMDIQKEELRGPSKTPTVGRDLPIAVTHLDIVYQQIYSIEKSFREPVQ